MHRQRLAGLLQSRLSRGYAHTGTEWPLRPFKPQHPQPPVHPSHHRGEGKFKFPAGLKEEEPFKMPPILDVSPAGNRRRKRALWHVKMQKLATVEEKIFELNMPRYYGWTVYQMNEGVLPYDPLPKTQYITRTHLVDEPGLPKCYDEALSSEDLDAAVQNIKGQVEDALELEYTCRNWNNQLSKDELEDKVFMENLKAKNMSQQINRILTNNLSGNYKHLLEAELDVDPRLEAFWVFGGFEAPAEAVKARENLSYLKEFKDEPTNQYLRYDGTPLLHLRHNLPLNEIMPMDESHQFRAKIPYEPLDPRKEGYIRELKRATIIPGFWPGDHSEFGIMSYNSTAHLAKRPKHYQDHNDALKSQAILGSFSWLYTQACYQGFSTFQDLTYPLVNQMILTNGQEWSFSVYQLNTTTMHIDCIDQNKKTNLCWITEPMKLFETVEDGKVKGFNEDVLKCLIKFYTNIPQARENIEMKPFLGKEQIIANIEDPERRTWLEEKYKHLVSNRSRDKLMPEIYHWQKIYKIKFKTRFMDKKRDPWEFGINPYQRRLDDHLPEYIPRCLREHHRSKKKFKKTYYPHVPEQEVLKEVNSGKY